MKHSKITSIALLMSALAINASADIFKLKDGRRLEGEIFLNSTDTYTLLVKVKKGVRDEIVIRKSDIESISKDDLSLDSFKALQKIIPTSDLLAAEDYQSLLDRKVTPFLKKYPRSAKLAGAKKIEALLLDEMQKAKNGAMKVDGKWLTAEEIAKNKYEFEAFIEANKVKAAARKGNFSKSLSTLNKMEKGYKNTQPFREALNMSLRFLPIYKAKAQKIADNAEKLTMKRDQSLERLASSQQGRIKRLLAAEEAKYQAKLSVSRRTGTKWLPLNRYHKDPANTVLKLIDKESSRLKKIADTSYVDSGELYRNILEAIDKNELDSAKAKLHEFTRARPPEVHSAYLKEKYSEAVTQMKIIERQKRVEAREEKRKAKAAARNAKKNKK